MIQFMIHTTIQVMIHVNSLQHWTHQQYELEAYGSGFQGGGVIDIDRADLELESESLNSAKNKIVW